ncbi:MAG: LptF/LptG family permease [Planctomycetota bacterium]
MKTMLTRLDRYVLRSFVMPFGMCLAAFAGLYVVIDAFDKLDEFMKRNLLEIYPDIFRYYLYMLPSLFRELVPASSLVAAMFTLANLSRQNEILAMKVAGLRVQRIYMPLVGVSVVLAAVLWVDTEIVVPRAAPRFFAALRQVRTLNFLANETWIADRLFVEQGSHRILFRRYNAPKQTMYQIMVTLDGEAGKSVIHAETAVWHDAGGRQGWLLRKCRIKQGEVDGAVIRERDEYFVESSITPEVVVSEAMKPMFMSSGALRKAIRENPGLHELAVEEALRKACPFSALVLLLLGIPFIERQQRRGQGIYRGFGLCLVLSFGYYTTGYIFQGMGAQAIVGPVVAAWSPIFIFGAIGAVLYGTMRA